MSRWSLVIPDDTDRMVRTHIASTGGKKGDLSKFVNEAVRKEVLRRTVAAVHKQNADLSESAATDLADEAVAWARANRP